MEGKLKIKFTSKEDYNEGLVNFMSMLDTWKNNAEEIKRDFDIIPNNDESEGRYEFNVVLKVEKDIV